MRVRCFSEVTSSVMVTPYFDALDSPKEHTGISKVLPAHFVTEVYRGHKGLSRKSTKPLNLLP